MGLATEDGDALRVVKALGPIPPRLVGQLWPVNDRPSILGRAVGQGEWQQVWDVLAPDLPPDPVVALGRDCRFRAALVERLLDVSRIQTGRLELVGAPVDLVALVRRVAEQEQVTTALHRIHVYTDLNELVGNWDTARIEQVLINLLDNAIKYSPKGGDIDVGVHMTAFEAQVSVRDHGIGISREDQKRVFERFYRAQMGRERPSGLGLGLYISYQIITLHDGRMWLESEPGKGSTFHFALPLAKDHQGVSKGP